jgi:hypothetical protein
MFVGHYGPALAMAGGRSGASLGAAFIAVQLVDFAWAGFILTGVERARVVPGATALSPLSLDFMPYTHSLPAAIGWSLLGALAYALIARRRSLIPAILIGVCVFSHWVLDFVVHSPDLEIWGASTKVGLGLWNVPAAGVAAELGVLTLGFIIYLSRTAPVGRGGSLAPWLVIAALLGLAVYNWLAPPPPNIAAMAISALAAYSVIAALGFYLDGARTARLASSD